MAAVTRTKANVRPLAGASVRRGTAGATIEAGEIVYLDGTNGWKPANGGAVTTCNGRGVAVGPQDISSGDELDIVMYGPVEGYSGMTPGATHYVSDTAGEVDTAAGTKNYRIGFAESATVLFVNPGIQADPS